MTQPFKHKSEVRKRGRTSPSYFANKTPLASLAPSKFVLLLMKNSLAPLAPSKLCRLRMLMLQMMMPHKGYIDVTMF